MNRRLQQLLDLEGLTQAQFAEHIGVGRASISHILNGRNKPGYDIIANILRRFPEVSPDWLIMGKGKPFRDKEPVPSTLFTEQNSDSALKPQENVTLELNMQGTVNNGDTNKFEDGQASEDDLSGDISDNTAKIFAPKTDKAVRKIKRITVYYDDNTFEELFR